MSSLAGDKPLGIGLRSNESKRDAEIAELNEGKIPRFQVQIYDDREDLPSIQYEPLAAPLDLFMDRFQEAVEGDFRFMTHIIPTDYMQDAVSPYGGWRYFDRSSDGPFGEKNRDKLGSAALESFALMSVQKSKVLQRAYTKLYGLKKLVTLDFEFSDATIQKKIGLEDDPSRSAQERITGLKFSGTIRSDYKLALEVTAKRHIFGVVEIYARTGVPITDITDPMKKGYISMGVSIDL